jgi:hypothetical protein
MLGTAILTRRLNDSKEGSGTVIGGAACAFTEAAWFRRHIRFYRGCGAVSVAEPPDFLVSSSIVSFLRPRGAVHSADALSSAVSEITVYEFLPGELFGNLILLNNVLGSIDG